MSERSAIDETDDPAWLIQQVGFEPAREREMETIFALGNGYLGIRGALVDPLPSSQADMFIAGVFGPKVAKFPFSEVDQQRGDRSRAMNVEIVRFPFPFRLAIRVGDWAFAYGDAEILDFERVLDLKQGILHQRMTFTDRQSRETTLHASQCASLADPHLLLQEAEITAGNHDHPLGADPSLTGLARTGPARAEDGFALAYPHLERLDAPRGSLASLDVFRTKGSDYIVAIGCRTLSEGTSPLRLQRLAAVYTSRDVGDPVAAVRAHLLGRAWADWAPLWRAHAARWAELWTRADLRFPGEPELDQAQRFNTYQLRIAADHDPRVSVGARGLTGRAYEGHVFWDTEIFAWPFYLHIDATMARDLLLYRYHTLAGARRRAAGMGCAGACYAWESAATGDDVTPHAIAIAGMDAVVPVYTGDRQIHVTADVAHAVVRYWRATRDTAFMGRYGAEILFETARFWASRAACRDGRYHIDHVIGPDEYHIDVNDNAFTNWMARENLQAAIACRDELSRTVPRAVADVTPADLEAWREVASRIYLPAPTAAGVLEQCEGFFDLRPAPQAADGGLAVGASLFNWHEVSRMRLCKQADVLMIPFLFPDALPPASVRANFDYYEPITTHASSLSWPVHAAVASQAGYREKAWRYWRDALFIDLSGSRYHTDLGFHVATAGGAWQAVFCHLLEASRQERRARQEARP